MVVFPAGAGVIPLWKALTLQLSRFPRRCGGDPWGNRYYSNLWAFSPQVRGWSTKPIIFFIIFPVFPAGAGVILTCLSSGCAPNCFPRRCGGDPKCLTWKRPCGKFSPQVRGWSHPASTNRHEFQVFPAGAGVILALKCRKASIHSFPRRCGGDPPTDEIYVIDRASSRNNRGEPCLWHSHKSIRFFQKMRLLFQDISEWCN